VTIVEVIFQPTNDAQRYRDREWDQHKVVLLDDGRIRIGDASDDYSFVDTSKPFIFQDGFTDEDGDWHPEFVLVPVINGGIESFASISPGRALALSHRFGIIIKTEYGEFAAAKIGA
jgi:hypothetical protein